jgi:uncharacterized repeat protein (TIGR01451 family)
MKHVSLSKRVFSILVLFVLLISFSPASAITSIASQPVGEGVAQQSISPEVLNHLGIQHPVGANMTRLSQEVASQVQARNLLSSPASPTSGGLPSNLSTASALSAAVMTSLSGSGYFNEVDLMGDLDGKEDLTADHSAKVNDFSSMPFGWSLTRNAISEHTIANGFKENIFYYGDTFGNVYVADSVAASQPVSTTVLNLPTILNAFGNLNSDDQVVITGLAVNPVSDLTAFPNVNGSFSFFQGKVGELLMVSFWDTGSGMRLYFNNQLVRSGVLAFPIADETSPAPAPPGIQSAAGFPVTVGGSFGVTFSVFSNLAGLAVDDDGNVYFQQVDLINFTGANIVKITSADQPDVTKPNPHQDRSVATSGFGNFTTLNPTKGNYGTSSGPSYQVNRFTNFSGTSTTFGNITALATGPNNVLYAAVARSYVATDPQDVKNTEGFFSNPDALGPTPSMIISFADTSGATDVCSAPPGVYKIIEPGPITVTLPFTGSLPIADGFADVAQSGMQTQPGVDNFRVFALGSGPDIRSATSAIGATPDNTQQVDFQIDNTIYSGLAVDEENKVYVISGGTPAGVGLNPSPSLGEILLFPDSRPYDRRADFIDLRGDSVPNGSNAGTAPADGKSDRYDHIFYQAPLSPSSTPSGLSGLSRGFLLYLNRTRNDASVFTGLPNGTTQGDDATSGQVFFDSFDAGHQVAGGDDQNFPFTGDDSDGGGNASIAGPLNGGFEFVCTGSGADCSNSKPLNAFYLNSNGSLTVASGDTSASPNSSSFLTGSAKFAPAWADLNTASRTSVYSSTFPVQALGFAGINDFKVRWIDVPEKTKEGCGSQNTFALSLFDDGTGVDENANQPLNPANPIGNNAVPFDLREGPTASLYYVDPNSGLPLPVAPRQDHSGYFRFDYGRMDLLGTSTSPVLVGYSAGGLSPTVLASNLSEAARAREAAQPNDPALPIGDPAALYEIFDTGSPPTITVSGGITMPVYAKPSFDLRIEGNDPSLSTPPNQTNQNRGRVDMVNQLPPLFSMIKHVITSTVEVGVPFSYTLSMVNSSSPATGVTISETLPMSTTFVSANQGGVQTGSGVRWTGFNVPQFGFLDLNWTIVPNCDTAGKNILDYSTFVTSTQNLAPTYANSIVVQALNQGVSPDFSYASLGSTLIQFTNLSQRATSYLWDFGDGTTSVLADPIHTFRSGTHTVKLTASNLCSSASTTQSIVIVPGPVFIPLAIK